MKMLSKKEKKAAIDMFERMAGALSVLHSLDHEVTTEEELDHTFFEHLLDGDYSFLWTEDIEIQGQNEKNPTAH